MAAYDNDDIINQALRMAREMNGLTGNGAPDPWMASNARTAGLNFGQSPQQGSTGAYRSFYDAAGVPELGTGDILKRLDAERAQQQHNDWLARSAYQRSQGVYSDDPEGVEAQSAPIGTAIQHFAEQIPVNEEAQQRGQRGEDESWLSWMSRGGPFAGANWGGLARGAVENVADWTKAAESGDASRIKPGNILAPPFTGVPTALATAATARMAPGLFRNPHLAGTGHMLGSNPHLNPEQEQPLAWTHGDWMSRHGYTEEPSLKFPEPEIARAQQIAREWQHSAPDKYTGFYSALTRSVEGAQMKSGTAQQWLNHFKKGGKDMPAVKDEELYWSGVGDWLKEQGGRKITRDELLTVAKEREVKPAVRENTSEGDDPSSFDEDHRQSEHENAAERVREEFTAENNGDGTYTLYRNGEPIKDGDEVETFASKREAMGRAEDMVREEIDKYLDDTSVYQRMNDYGQDIREQTSGYFDEQMERAGIDPKTYYEQVHGVRQKDLDRRGSKGMDRTDELGNDPHPYTTLPHTTGWTLAAKGKDLRTRGDVRRIIELQGNWPQEAQKRGFKGSVTPEEMAALQKARDDAEALRKETAREYINLDEHGAYQFKPHVSSEDRGRMGNAMREFYAKMNQNARDRQRLADNIADNEQRLATNENYVRRFTEQGNLDEAKSAAEDVAYLQKRIAEKRAEFAHLDEVIANAKQHFDETYLPHVTRIPRDLRGEIQSLRDDVGSFRAAAERETTSKQVRKEMLEEAAKKEQELARVEAEFAALTPEQQALIQAYDDWSMRNADARLRAREADEKLRAVQSGIEPGPWVGSHGDDKGWMNTQLKHTLYQAAKEGDEFVSVNPTEAAEHWGREGNKDFYGRTIPESMVKLAKQHGFKGGLEDVYLGDPPAPPRAQVEIGRADWHRPERNGQDVLPYSDAALDRQPFDIFGTRPIKRIEAVVGPNQRDVVDGGGLRYDFNKKHTQGIASGEYRPFYVLRRSDGTYLQHEYTLNPITFRSAEAAEAAMREYNAALAKARRERPGFDPDDFEGVTDVGIRLTPEVRQSIIDKGFTTFAKSDIQDAAVRAAIEAAGGDPIAAALETAKERAKALGHFDTTFHHGTTHDIKPTKGFIDPAKDYNSPYEPASYHGPAIYMSSSASDASGNYAGHGPDLKNRIAQRAEQYEYDMRDADPKERAVLKRYATKLEKSGDIPDGADYYLSRSEDLRLAYAKAHRELTGNRIHMLDLRTNPKNPVRLGEFEGQRETFFPLEQRRATVEKDGDGWVVKDHDGDVVERFDDEGRAYDAADEITYSREPDGPASLIIDKLRGRGLDRVADDIYQHALDREGISAKDLENIIRKHDQLWDDGDFEHGPGPLLQELYRYLGHDAVIMPNADQVFTGMNIPRGTTHVALFDNSRVRRTDAKFDPKKVNSTNLLASDALQSAEARAALHAADPVDEAMRVAREVDQKRAYHWSGNPEAVTKSGKFEPFTHFGTAKAAEDRFTNPAGSYSVADLERQAANPGSVVSGGTFPVDLNIKNPLRIKDSGTHTPASVAYDVFLGLKKAGIEVTPAMRDEMVEAATEAYMRALSDEQVNKLAEATENYWYYDEFGKNPETDADWMREFMQDEARHGTKQARREGEPYRDAIGYHYNRLFDVEGDEAAKRAAFDAVNDVLAEHGYDGLIYKNEIEGGGADSYIATKPGTVKSSITGNTLYADNLQSAEARAVLHAADPTEEALRVAREVPTLKAYHGTTSQGPAREGFKRIDGGNARGDAYYFTTDPDSAGNGYALGNTNRITPKGDGTPNVVPVDINAHLYDENAMISPDERRALAEAFNKDVRERAAAAGRQPYPDELMDPDEFASTWFDRAYPPRGYNVLQSLTYDPTEQNKLLASIGYQGRRGGAHGRGTSGQDIAIFPEHGKGTVKSSITGNTLYADNADTGARSVLRESDWSSVGIRAGKKTDDVSPRWHIDKTNNHEGTATYDMRYKHPKGMRGGFTDEPESDFSRSLNLRPRSDGSGEFVYPFTEPEEALQRKEGVRAAPDLYADNADKGARSALRAGEDKGNVVSFPSRQIPEGYKPPQARDLELPIMDTVVKGGSTYDVLDAAAPLLSYMRDAYGHIVMQKGLPEHPAKLANGLLNLARALRIVRESPEFAQHVAAMKLPKDSPEYKDAARANFGNQSVYLGQRGFGKQIDPDSGGSTYMIKAGASPQEIADYITSNKLFSSFMSRSPLLSDAAETAALRSGMRGNENWKPLVEAYQKGGDEALARAIKQQVPDIESAVKLWDSTPELGQLSWDGRPLVNQIADAAKHMARAGDSGIDDAVLLADNAQSAGARAALGAQRDVDALGYYSAALEAAKGLKQAKGTGEQMLRQIEATPGVKKAEISATGLDKFLTDKPSVTKQEIVDFLGENRVGLRENQYSGRPGTNEPVSKWQQYSLDPSNPSYRETVMHLPPKPEKIKMAELEPFGQDGSGEAMWEGRTLVKGVKEAPFQIGNQFGRITYWPETYGNLRRTPNGFESPPTGPAYIVNSPNFQNARFGSLAEARAAIERSYEDAGGRASMGSAREDVFRSGHWSEPNVIAHARTAMYKDTAGKNVFLVDELQSDWAQKIRDGGTRDEAKVAELKKASDEALAERKQAVDDLKALQAETQELSRLGTPLSLDTIARLDRSDIMGRAPTEQERGLAARAKELQKRLDETEKAYRLRSSELKTAEAATPGHPLVNTTDQWTTTALRRLVKQAVDNGADAIALTPGKVQAERFNLARQVGDLNLSNVAPDGRSILEDGKRVLRASPRDGRGSAITQVVSSEDELAQYVGKEYAKRLWHGEPNESGIIPNQVYTQYERVRGARGHHLELDEDMVLGGEGMKYAYDTMYPKMLGKLLSKIDPSIKMETREIVPHDFDPKGMIDIMGKTDKMSNTYRKWSEYRKGTPFENQFISFPITDKVREAVKGGQALFSKADDSAAARAGVNAAGEHNEGLSYLIEPKSKAGVIGAETGTVKPNGISVLKSAHGVDGYEGNRIVYAKDGEIVGAMQVMKTPNTGYVVANTYVRPEFRRSGIATQLNDFAKQRFGDLERSEGPSVAGEAFRKSLKPKRAQERANGGRIAHIDSALAVASKYLH